MLCLPRKGHVSLTRNHQDQNGQPQCLQCPVMASPSPHPSNPKALIFDLIGTCTDWYTSILPALQSAPPLPTLPAAALPQLAVEWRAGFFKEVDTRRQAGQSVEDIDVTHRRVLNYLLLARGVTPAMWDDGVRNGLVLAWHRQKCR